jgi:Flp pilus assembly protein TadB
VQSPSGVTVIVVGAAVVVAGISLVFEPFSLVVLAALSWVWVSRRRRAERKHEGLRVLR